MKIKKILLLSFAFILMLPLLTGCNQPQKTIITDKTSAFITGWYEYSNVNYFDTSVTFDNTALPYTSWEKVTFTLYKPDGSKLGDAISEGNNLTNLLNDSKNYWAEGQTQLILSNAFKPRTDSENNGYWVRSVMNIEENSSLVGFKLVVEIETQDTIFKSEYTKQA